MRLLLLSFICERYCYYYFICRCEALPDELTLFVVVILVPKCMSFRGIEEISKVLECSSDWTTESITRDLNKDVIILLCTAELI
jgi:hypothetical protein